MNAYTLQRFGAVALGGLLLVGCAATTQLGAQFVDPALPKQALRGTAILVVCENVEPAIKAICETQLSAQLVTLGARPVTDATLVNPMPGREPPAGQYLPAAKAAGARAVLSVTLAADYTVVNPAPSFSIGIGGFGGSGGYRGGSGVGGGVGVTMPVGSASATSGLGAVGSLIDVGNGRLMWSARVTTPPASDVTGQIGEVTRALTGSLQQSGLF